MSSAGIYPRTTTDEHGIAEYIDQSHALTAWRKPGVGGEGPRRRRQQNGRWGHGQSAPNNNRKQEDGVTFGFRSGNGEKAASPVKRARWPGQL